MDVILIAVFGAAGVLARHLLGTHFTSSGLSEFPWHTVGINISGSFLIGFVTMLVVHRSPFVPDQIKVPILVGFLGGFTTFSTFSLEFLQLAQKKDIANASLYFAITVGGGLIACLLGLTFGKYPFFR